MNNDWQPRDMAVCISSGNWKLANNKSTGPRPGQLLTVRAVGVCSKGIKGLWFDEFPGTNFCDGFEAKFFMKVTPPKIADQIIREVENVY